MEVPLSEADAAYQILGGMPNFSEERWFGIAPLKNPPAAKETLKAPAEPQVDKDKHQPAAKRMDWRELQPAAQAGIRCTDVVFWAFLNETQTYRITHILEASEAVREICGVKSRAELGTNHKARVLWHSLDEQFQAWKLAERVGA
jgi:PAS domain-containing protein